MPGGDVNPYLALAGLIAAGLSTGSRTELQLAAAGHRERVRVDGAAAGAGLAREALALWVASPLAAERVRRDVVDHYATMARVELEAYHAAVTDWELRRYFERI